MEQATTAKAKVVTVVREGARFSFSNLQASGYAWLHLRGPRSIQAGPGPEPISIARRAPLRTHHRYIDIGAYILYI